MEKKKKKKKAENTRWPNQLTINILNPHQLKPWNALHSSSYKHVIIIQVHKNML